MRLTAAGSCATPRRPRIVRPTETGRSKSALDQSSIGLRCRARIVESDPRGLSGRRGYGGTKSLEAVEATGMANALEQRCVQYLGHAAPGRQGEGEKLALGAP